MISRRHPEQRGLPLALWIILVVLVPLVGSIPLGKAQFDDARRAAETAAEVDALVADAVANLGLRNAILSEQSWQLILRGLDVVGLTTEMVTALTGIEPLSELGRAVADVDRLADDVGDASVTASIQLLRDELPSEVADIAADYDLIADSVGDVGRRRLTELLEYAGAAPDAARLATSVQALVAASEAQRAIVGVTTSQFGARFGDLEEFGVGGEDRRQLLGELAVYDAAAADLDALPLSPAVEDQWSTLRDTHDFRSLTSSIETLANDIVASGDGVTADPLRELSASADLLRYGSATLDAHDTLVLAAARGVSESARELRVDADDAARSTAIWGLLLLVATSVVALGVARFIVIPARRLAAGAEQIERGHVDTHIEASGPAELRNATRALNNTSAALGHVEYHARRLADPDRRPGEIDTPMPGALGESLRLAMEQLARSISERESLRTELAHRADHDELTGLANRRATLARLEESIDRARASGRMCAVLFIDLDHFKDVNDRLGHATGDSVLRTVASRISEVVRTGDLVGRLGGDEFLVVAEPIEGTEEVRRLADRIIETVSRPIDTPGGEASVGASVGAALTSGAALTGDLSPRQLLALSDEAVYSAKRHGKGCVSFASAESGASMADARSGRAHRA